MSDFLDKNRRKHISTKCILLSENQERQGQDTVCHIVVRRNESEEETGSKASKDMRFKNLNVLHFCMTRLNQQGCNCRNCQTLWS